MSVIAGKKMNEISVKGKGVKMKIAIIAADFHKKISGEMVSHAKKAAKKSGRRIDEYIVAAARQWRCQLGVVCR